MNYINKVEKLEKITLTKDNFYVVADFDKTLTSGISNTTWGSIASTGVLPKEYAEERQNLYKKYRPIEIDSQMDVKEKCNYMSEWWQKHINLFYKYGLKENAIKAAASNEILQFREGSKAFIEYLYKNNIPLIIVSAGIGNIIKEFLVNNNCNYDNITIISNFIEFENGNMKCISGGTIHALNKNITELPEETKKLVENKEYIILLGDGLADIDMVQKELLYKTISIGFLEEKIVENLNAFNNTFDIVCTNNTSMDEAIQIIKRYSKSDINFK
jgi:5'-nucleotidase